MMNDTTGDRQPVGLAPVHGSARLGSNKCPKCGRPSLASETCIECQTGKAVCAEMSDWRPQRGEKWELWRIEQGHVFGWRIDDGKPDYQCSICVFCGRAYHQGVFPAPLKARQNKPNSDYPEQTSR